MSNQLALILGVTILSGLAFDAYSYDSANALFVSRKFLELLEWVAFWR